MFLSPIQFWRIGPRMISASSKVLGIPVVADCGFGPLPAVVGSRVLTLCLLAFGVFLVIVSEVEAALIDAYPGLTNRMGGAGSNDRGVRLADQTIREHDAPEFELKHPLILISIGKTYEERGVYEAVRGLWSMNGESP